MKNCALISDSVVVVTVKRVVTEWLLSSFAAYWGGHSWSYSYQGTAPHARSFISIHIGWRRGIPFSWN